MYLQPDMRARLDCLANTMKRIKVEVGVWVPLATVYFPLLEHCVLRACYYSAQDTGG